MDDSTERTKRIEEFKAAHKGYTTAVYIECTPPVELTAEDYADGKCVLTLTPPRHPFEPFDYTERS